MASPQSIPRVESKDHNDDEIKQRNLFQEPFLYIHHCGPIFVFNPNKSDKIRAMCVKRIKSLFKNHGKVTCVKFKKNNKGRNTFFSSLVWLESGSLSERMVEKLDREGKVTIKKTWPAPKNWSGPRDPLTKWKFHVVVNKYLPLSEEELRESRRKRFNKAYEAVMLSDSDSDSDLDSDA